MTIAFLASQGQIFIFARKKGLFGEIKAGVVMQPDPDEFLNIDLSGGTIEYKMKDPSGGIPQAIANMVRVACNLLRDALKVGKVVKLITIFGLLISYENGKCIPLKYIADFEKVSTQVYVGLEEDFKKMLPFLIIKYDST